ncbi:hypothetical protein [Streptomyces sp. NPDC055709]
MQYSVLCESAAVVGEPELVEVPAAFVEDPKVDARVDRVDSVDVWPGAVDALGQAEEHDGGHVGVFMRSRRGLTSTRPAKVRRFSTA